MTTHTRHAGILGDLHVPLGLGLLRLTTEGRPSEGDAIAVIHFALDHGFRVLDTADAYALDDKDLHYGERLVRIALDAWKGPRDEVKILTKIGMARPKGKWIPNGRPDHLRKAVDGSLQSLGVEQLFLLQLHVHDARVAFEDTLATLADLQKQGKVAHLGLCNTTAGEIQQAQSHFKVAAVQNELSVLTRKSAADGLLELTRDLGIPFLAHRPLGGYAKVEKLTKNKILGPLSERHHTTPHEIALAALLDAAPHVIPLIGATRIDSVRSCLKALDIKLDISDRAALGIKFSFAADADAVAGNARLFARSDGAPMHGPRATGATTSAELPKPVSTPDVVILMGIQGSGKSSLVDTFVNAGYARLNRDILGGRLDDLVPHMLQLFLSGQRRVILDNTYPTRVSRAPVVAAAYSQGVPVRCVHLQIPLPEAHVNIVLRNLEKYGRLLGPEDIKVLVKNDPTLPPPLALARWVSTFEAPSLGEGFASLDVIPFVRRIDPTHTARGLLLDVDGTVRKTKSGAIYPSHADDVELLPGRRDVLARWINDGYQLFFVSNQSGIASGKLDRAAAESAFARTVELLGLPVTEVVYCPHPAFPAGCYCRKPMPGLGIYLMQRHRLSREHLVMVGDMDSDADFAAGIGARYFDAATFFSWWIAPCSILPSRCSICNVSTQGIFVAQKGGGGLCDEMGTCDETRAAVTKLICFARAGSWVACRHLSRHYHSDDAARAATRQQFGNGQ
jgi:HAD superfamily hydrolase (TIGR01662 family)